MAWERACVQGMGTVASGGSLCPVHGDSGIWGTACTHPVHGDSGIWGQSVSCEWGQWHLKKSLCPVASLCVIGTWYWKGEGMAKSRKALLSR